MVVDDGKKLVLVQPWPTLTIVKVGHGPIGTAKQISSNPLKEGGCANFEINEKSLEGSGLRHRID